MLPAELSENLFDVVIAGAGPIGMTLASLLARLNFRVLILEKRTHRSKMSRAIGITPPSLRILSKLDLDQDCIAAGLKIQDATVHGHSSPTGDLDFHDLPGDYPFILSLPQSAFEDILEERITETSGIELRKEVEVTGFKETGESIRVFHSDPDNQPITARWLIACDGAGSRLRELAGVTWQGRPYPCRFSMADFVDRSRLGSVAHLYFSRHGTIESFPLPGGQRRWIA
ncbi:MAG: FAD-dependent monooxygenase, partial [Verrucomicrobiae bacterium]|nr:FAD-dependent monooxygenase [Verrucomicrobiae bacterium]